MFSKEIWKISQERYFKTNYGFWRNLSYWRWMRWCVVWSRRKSKYNTWLWFVLRFSSRTRAGNEDFIVIFGGTKSSGIFFFKEANLMISELHSWILATVCPHGCAFKPTAALYCHWISSVLESVRGATQERDRNLFANSLHYSGQNMVLIYLVNASLLLGVAACALCVCVL